MRRAGPLESTLDPLVGELRQVLWFESKSRFPRLRRVVVPKHAVNTQRVRLRSTPGCPESVGRALLQSFRNRRQGGQCPLIRNRAISGPIVSNSTWRQESKSTCEQNRELSTGFRQDRIVGPVVPRMRTTQTCGLVTRLPGDSTISRRHLPATGFHNGGPEPNGVVVKVIGRKIPPAPYQS